MRTVENTEEIPTSGQRQLDERAIPVIVSGGTVAIGTSIQVNVGTIVATVATGSVYASEFRSDTFQTGTLTAGVIQVSVNTGTLANETTLSGVYNNQGTLATLEKQFEQTGLLAATYISQGTLATQAGVAAVANNQGTLATFAKQSEQTGLLAATYVSQGTLATQAGVAAIANSQGTLATATGQTVTNTLLSAIYSNQGTLAENPLARDAFGRWRVSTPYTLFDSKQLLDGALHLWSDQPTSGTGTSSTYDRVGACVRLAVSNLTAGTRARQTFRRFNYQPGKAQLILMTFALGAAATGITRRVGYFDNNNGLYLEQTASGPSFVIRKNGLASEAYAQANWNVDKLDGLGASGLTLDLSKAQILFIDFEWLGVGTAYFGFVINGQFIRCHAAHHANVTTSVYMSTPNLPLRYEISNDGSGAATDINCICSSVLSEGGQEITGFPRSIDRGATGFVTLNDSAMGPILGIRQSTAGTYASLTVTQAQLLCTTSAVIHYQLVVNPQISGDAVAWTSLSSSAIEYANQTDTAGVTNIASGGTVIASGYAAAGQPSTEIIPPNFFGLGSSLGGVRDELWLCAQRLTGTTETIYGSIDLIAQD